MPSKKVFFKRLKGLQRRIREIRLSNKMTHSEIAKVFYVTGNAVKKWEEGDTTEPPLGYLEYLVESFGCDIGELMFGVPENSVAAVTDQKDEIIAALKAAVAAQEQTIEIQQTAIEVREAEIKRLNSELADAKKEKPEASSATDAMETALSAKILAGSNITENSREKA